MELPTVSILSYLLCLYFIQKNKTLQIKLLSFYPPFPVLDPPVSSVPWASVLEPSPCQVVLGTCLPPWVIGYLYVFTKFLYVLSYGICTEVGCPISEPCVFIAYIDINTNYLVHFFGGLTPLTCIATFNSFNFIWPSPFWCTFRKFPMYCLVFIFLVSYAS